ncbi:hypothetical protein LTR09_007810 [Extremus antarcticus]|uniref:Putative gamma-glutamylcyclotransferase n=1 Tax=Extremus antarcticus TaxID=702011 RepID=A0AAJ0GAW3_9PEZI|nr:hypothetical protein LTR09_007810 [Extremus antarcticus]
MAATPSDPQNRSAFFYGTLMAPQVLHRVCHGSAAHGRPTHHTLKTSPAILHNHRRHRVKDADYPAIVPTEGASVRGTYVSGLTDADIWRLDIFEGSEYERVFVKAKLLEKVGDEGGEGNVEGEEVDAETYVWCGRRSALDEREWDFGEFQREKMKYWVGGYDAEYVEVDEAVANQSDGTGGRSANGGAITEALKEEMKKHEQLNYSV